VTLARQQDDSHVKPSNRGNPGLLNRAAETTTSACLTPGAAEGKWRSIRRRRLNIQSRINPSYRFPAPPPQERRTISSPPSDRQDPGALAAD
jgi:hypothetical protein